MTLPHERSNSLRATKDFLMALLDPKQTPGVPKSIRFWAKACLRHYPYDHHLEEIDKKVSKHFGGEDICEKP